MQNNDNGTFYILVGDAEQQIDSPLKIFPVVGDDGQQIDSPLKNFPDTPEEQQKAIDAGYTAGSSISFLYDPERIHTELIHFGSNIAFAYDPEILCPELVRYGSLFLNFDDTCHPEVATSQVRELTAKLVEYGAVDPGSLRYWMNGVNGCLVEIPPIIYGGENGHLELPLVQAEMLALFGIVKLRNSKIFTNLDHSLYLPYGKLLYWPNIKQTNGRYMVPVSAWEFFNLSYPELERLTLTPRIDFDPGTKEPVKSSRLAEIFNIIVGLRRKFAPPLFGGSSIEEFFHCPFITYFVNHQATLEETDWWIMISIISTLGDIGRDTIHFLGRDCPDYSFEEIEKKIEQIKVDQELLACDCTKMLEENCGQNCKYRSPAALLN